MKIDWSRKLSSRKFWVCVCGFVSTLIMGFGVAENVATQIISTIMAGGCLVAYILAEGWIDAASVENAEKNEAEVYTMNNAKAGVDGGD